MKKIWLVFLFMFRFSLSFADFYDGSLSKFIEFDLSSSTTRGIERYNTLYSVQAGFASSWLDGILGFQGYEDAFDVTVAGEGWIPFTNWCFDTARIALGVGGLYHFERYKDISFENDFIFDSCFRYQNARGWTFTFRSGYVFKKTKIDAIFDFVSYIYDDYPDAGMLIEKLWQNGFEFYFEHALHDLYRYPHFCAPHYTFGAAMNMDSGLRVGGEVSLRIVDQYATSPYIDSLILRMTARYTF